MNPQPIALCWSGGKDSALALQTLRESDEFEVRVLLTTVTQNYDRVSIHGVRGVLLKQQARSLDVPLEIALVAPSCSNDEYESSFGAALDNCRAQGIANLASGDLFLQDVRAYREALAKRHDFKMHFPLWGRDTTRLAEEFIGAGYKAILTCVDTNALGGEYSGRAFDAELLRDLPPSVDPCGENGEFHTFVWDGPGFSFPIHCVRGETILRENRFAFCDLLPVGENS